MERFSLILQVLEELRAVARISVPSALTGLLLYSRSFVSMLFLGSLGELELAGGSLSIGFANITGYSILSGLAMGMEPICGQAFGSRNLKLVGITLHRTILLLLATSLPISFLWLNIRPILLWCGQDPEISVIAAQFLAVSVPDLLVLSILHPLRIYLRTQNIVLPITNCSLLSTTLHLPISYLLVKYFELSIAGVALAAVWTNFNLLLFLAIYMLVSGVHSCSWVRPGVESIHGWSSLLHLPAPTCAAVCLEWWWYELMIILCGLLTNPKAAVASMGIIIQTTSLVYVFPASLSHAVSTRLGNELGAGRRSKASLSVTVAMCCAIMLGIGSMVFTITMRHQWGRLFTTNSEILELTATALPIVGLCELGNCPQTAGCGVLRGSARPSVGDNINFGAFYGVGLPVAVLLGFLAGMGFEGLWVGLLAAQLMCAGLMANAIARTDWAAETERARELTKLSSSPSYTLDCATGEAGVLEEILCAGDGGGVATETDPVVLN